VCVGVLFAGLFGMVRRVHVMPVREMGVVSGLFVVGATMVFRRPAVVLGGGFVMLGGFLVVFGQQACVHDLSLLYGGRCARARIGHRGDDARPVGVMTVP
jgi:hypothetical protein